jgi:hypothetical protein
MGSSPPTQQQPQGETVKAATAPPEVGTPAATWVPSRKWFASQVTLLSGLAISVIDEGWTDTQWKALVGIAAAAVISYLLPNAEQK